MRREEGGDPYGIVSGVRKLRRALARRCRVGRPGAGLQARPTKMLSLRSVGQGSRGTLGFGWSIRYLDFEAVDIYVGIGGFVVLIAGDFDDGQMLAGRGTRYMVTRCHSVVGE